MNKTIIITRPKYDDGTEYLAYYASLILKQAKEKQIPSIDIEGKNVTIEIISRFIEKQNPKLLFLNGHGDIDSIYGKDNNSILFSLDKNISLLKNRIVYARACNAAISLGKKAVEGNEGCFIGYNYLFSFWLDQRWSAKPSNDKIAALFLEPSNEVITSLFKGNTVETADKRSKDMMIKNMRRILKMEERKEPGAMGWLKTLWTNYESQVVLGNNQATF